ncbi:hypothetical protein COK29_26350, partial [Bacillus cereus]
MFANGIIHSAYADNTTNKIDITQTKKEELDRKGLIGYYFKGDNFNDLVMFAPTRDSTLIYDQQTANHMLDKQKQEYHSI